MKIHIISNEGFKIKLWMPTSLLKRRFMYKLILKKWVKSIEPLLKKLPTGYKSLKKYIKKQTFFVLSKEKSITFADTTKNVIKIKT